MNETKKWQPSPAKNNAIKIDGTAIAEQLIQEANNEAELLRKKGIIPRLEVILAGNHEPSRIYVNNKTKACDKAGIAHNTNFFPENITTKELIDCIAQFNDNGNVHGILVQLPLPDNTSKEKVLQAVSPIKDVDGIHPNNMGLLMAGKQWWNPCTPGGILELFLRYSIPLEGKHCVIIGRSDIVGKPLALLLLQQNVTITMCHSKTRNIPELVKSADIICAAMGKPAFVLPEYVKNDTVIIDVGVNRINDEKIVDEIFGPDSPKKQTFVTKGSVLVGDVHPDAYLKASHYTPVPGGVGPMTIATLIKNTVCAARVQMEGK